MMERENLLRSGTGGRDTGAPACGRQQGTGGRRSGAARDPVPYFDSEIYPLRGAKKPIYKVGGPLNTVLLLYRLFHFIDYKNKT